MSSLCCAKSLTPTLLSAPRRCSLLPCAALSPVVRCVLAAQTSNHAPHWNLPQVLHPPGGDSSGCAGGRHRAAGMVCAVAGRAAFCRVPPRNRAGRRQWRSKAGGRTECGSSTGAGAAGTREWQRRTGRCRLSSSALPNFHDLYLFRDAVALHINVNVQLQHCRRVVQMQVKQQAGRLRHASFRFFRHSGRRNGRLQPRDALQLLLPQMILWHRLHARLCSLACMPSVEAPPAAGQPCCCMWQPATSYQAGVRPPSSAVAAPSGVAMTRYCRHSSKIDQSVWQR